MAYYTVPILVNDGAIQAFERFVDWRQFSVKISIDTFFNDTRRTAFRQRLRNESDRYRSHLFSCWNQVYGLKLSHFRNMSSQNSGERQVKVENRQILSQLDTKWLMLAINGSVSECAAILETLMWKKGLAMQRVFPWFDFSNTSKEKHAFRLLTLEIWCQLVNLDGIRTLNFDSICTKRKDMTARIEYFDEFS